MPVSLGQLAAQFGCELVGDPDVVVDDVASLPNAGEGSISFLSNPAFLEQLSSTRAAAVILRDKDVEHSPTASLVTRDPYATYARIASVVRPAASYPPGVHKAAVVDSSADVHDSAHIAANAFVDAGSTIAARAYVGPGTYVGPDCRVGEDCRLLANVTLARAVQLGERCIIHPGAVLGADGFGNAMTPDGWIKVPQLGGVRIGADVEIGCNTTVDCGALDDTVIENGVRIDNLCMIAHNVHVGEHTAMAAMTGIAGSTRIGARCMFAGQSGAVGHIEICDDVVISGQGMLSKSINEPGVYASSFPSENVRDWNRKVARFRRLDSLFDRVKKLEKDL